MKWRLMSSIGTTCAWPPPAAPPLTPKHGPSDGSRIATIDPLAQPAERVAEADRGRRLAFAGRRRRHRGDQHQRAVGIGVAPFERLELNLGFVRSERLDGRRRHPEIGGDLIDRPQRRRSGDVDVAFTH